MVVPVFQGHNMVTPPAVISIQYYCNVIGFTHRRFVDQFSLTIVGYLRMSEKLGLG